MMGLSIVIATCSTFNNGCQTFFFGSSVWDDGNHVHLKLVIVLEFLPCFLCECRWCYWSLVLCCQRWSPCRMRWRFSQWSLQDIARNVVAAFKSNATDYRSRRGDNWRMRNGGDAVNVYLHESAPSIQAWNERPLLMTLFVFWGI